MCAYFLCSKCFCEKLQIHWINSSIRMFTKAKSGSGDLILPHLKWPIISSWFYYHKFIFEGFCIFLSYFLCQSCLSLSDSKFFCQIILLDLKILVIRMDFCPILQLYCMFLYNTHLLHVACFYTTHTFKHTHFLSFSLSQTHSFSTLMESYVMSYYLPIHFLFINLLCNQSCPLFC